MKDNMEIYNESIYKSMSDVINSPGMQSIKDSMDIYTKAVSDIANSPGMQSIRESTALYHKAISDVVDSPGMRSIKDSMDIYTKAVSDIANSPGMQSMRESTDLYHKAISDVVDSPGMQSIKDSMDICTKAVSDIANSPGMQSIRDNQSTFSEMIESLINNTSILENYSEKTYIEKELESIVTVHYNIEASDKDKRLNDLVEAIYEIFPQIAYIKKSLEERNFTKASIAFIIETIAFLIITYPLYTAFVNSDRHYMVNRENVRVRSTPEAINNKNIITKLSQNTYIKKIDSDNGWIKVKFELKEGVKEEGWIYRTMLTKMD